MSAFPAERNWFRRFVPAVAAVAFTVGAFGAAATATDHDRPTQPLQLVPPAALAPAGSPTPGHSVIETGTLTPARAAAKRVGDIEVNPLDEIAPDSIGTLGPDAGGFGVQMWRGSDRQIVARLFRLLPDTMNSRGMRDLARRLLTSIAAPPNGQLGVVDDGGSSLLTLRVERLMALGEIQDINDLLAVVPSRNDDEYIARTRVDALLLAQDLTQACRLVRNGIAAYHEVPYWQKAMVLCQMVTGELDQMMLGLDLLREQGGVDDPVFFALAGVLFGAEPDIPDDAELIPVHLAMMRATGAPWSIW